MKKKFAVEEICSRAIISNCFYCHVSGVLFCDPGNEDQTGGGTDGGVF